MGEVTPADVGPPRYPGDRRPSWAPGNRAGLRNRLSHGAHSPTEYRPIADELSTMLVGDAPWTGSVAFAGARDSWACAEARAILLRNWIDEHGLFDSEGEPWPAVALLERVEATLAKLRDGLGLTPMALGRLLAAAAQVATATGDGASLAALAAEGRSILASRLAQSPDGAETPADHGEPDPTEAA